MLTQLRDTGARWRAWCSHGPEEQGEGGGGRVRRGLLTPRYNTGSTFRLPYIGQFVTQTIHVVMAQGFMSLAIHVSFKCWLFSHIEIGDKHLHYTLNIIRLYVLALKMASDADWA